jgi:hypothetical protein
MNLRHLVPLVALLGLPVVSFAQKAYEVVKYAGKADAVSVSFDFADGYPEASELTVSSGGQQATLAAEGMEMMFRGSLAGKPVEVRLALDPMGAAPAKVEATVVTADGETKVTLQRR